MWKTIKHLYFYQQVKFIVLFTEKWNAPTGWGQVLRVSYSFKGKCVAPALPAPALLSGRQPCKSVSVTALWCCSKAGSTSQEHSGLETRQTFLLAAHASNAWLLLALLQPQGLPRWLRIAQGAALAASSPLWLLDLLGCPQHQGHCSWPLSAPRTPWSPLCRGLRKVGQETQVPFAFQRLTPSHYSHRPSGR